MATDDQPALPTAQEYRLQVPRTARYFQLGELATARQLWVVCHGYGQLAEYFIRHFRGMVTTVSGTAVVAPEGLSHFYLQGTSGRVGASWMTREDRLTEIEDYTRYLDELMAQLLPQCPTGVRVTVLGFSQGASTASRWLMRSAFSPARLVLWAGSFPEDEPAERAVALFQNLPTSVVCGSADEYVTETRLQEQLMLLRTHGAQPKLYRFAGGHELNADVLLQLAAAGQ